MDGIGIKKEKGREMGLERWKEKEGWSKERRGEERQRQRKKEGEGKGETIGYGREGTE